ncbi:class I SAM-dependent DNA methyltransferase [Caproiciproducens galactitolivorans]|uniref:HsdM family class I SAM-dependent methyltransferase n=1 Tax=Caproiciproducens galactitolivorans TaxID=642589 RepID=UPI00240A30AA|nr:N-6 DNA methylase [Caproiciproducens galactitolivorans]
MANERLTENIVREHFKNDPLFTSIKFEEQKSTNIRIADCLSNASKHGKGIGKPEFIITFPTQSMDYLIIVECKANLDKHESSKRDKPKDYAVDGVLHYSKFLSSEFNVLSIAVSGETQESLIVSNFIQKKGEDTATELPDKKLLNIFDYVKTFKNEQFNYNLKDVNIVEKAVKLNDDFHSCSISESMRNTLVSGILLALQDDMFKASYPVSKSSYDLATALIDAIKRVLKSAKVRKLDDMMGVYSKILDEPLVKEATIKKKKKPVSTIEFFKDTIKYLHEQVFPLTQYEESGYDVLGRFYTEFVRYAASKQKQGLVLTPSHVTELFCDLVNIKVSDVVYDPCCGTGGFLIAAMKKMLDLAGNDETRKTNIRKNQLLGVEIRPEMFTFACSNMMLRGDGKSNIDRGDCFDKKTIDRIKKLKPTVAFLNPPYDQGTDVQLEFIEKALEAVEEQNGKVAAIVQMSCAIKDDTATKVVRKRLLEKHTLKAVISMPDDLFYPVGVVTCIMVFEANSPNKGKKTWFGYLKDDGFTKRKNKGRIDFHNRWKDIKSNFIQAYINNDEVVGLSVKKEVNYDDEWCAEAYMETDYSKITSTDFEEVMKKYVMFKTIGLTDTLGGDDDAEEN